MVFLQIDLPKQDNVDEFIQRNKKLIFACLKAALSLGVEVLGEDWAVDIGSQKLEQFELKSDEIDGNFDHVQKCLKHSRLTF